jgi:hypothetical protein
MTQKTVVDESGAIQISEETTESKRYINNEPEFVKIYHDKWRELTRSQKLSDKTKLIFISIVNRMCYCNTKELRTAQIIRIDSDERIEIMEECDISNEKVFYRHLKILIDCGVIRPAVDSKGNKRRSIYQVNPFYAGKGHWHVRGLYPGFGICDLQAKWDDPYMYTYVKD